MRQLILSSVSLLLFVVFLIFYFTREEPIRYINTASLYSSFTLTKQLLADFSSKAKGEENTIDSLLVRLNYFQKDEAHKKEYLQLQQELSNKQVIYRKWAEASAREIEQVVWKQLNQYLRNYGKAHAYSIILGTQGNGNILYTKEGLEITEDVIKFVNQQYEGRKN